MSITVQKKKHFGFNETNVFQIFTSVPLIFMLITTRSEDET